MSARMTVLWIALGSVLLAQDARQSDADAFEVISVKPSPPVRLGESFASAPGRFLPGGRFEATNVTVVSLIYRAYPEFNGQPPVGPQWLAQQRFDVRAIAPKDAQPEKLIGMLRNLLAQRFGLRWHAEQRAVPAYDLVVHRKDGRLGPAVRPTTTDCPTGRVLIDLAQPREIATSTEPCITKSQALNDGRRIDAVGRTMVDVANMLRSIVGRPISDKTGLQGRFDFRLQWSTGSDPQNGAADVFVALVDQLGLKLESAFLPLSVMVIDIAHTPAPD